MLSNIENAVWVLLPLFAALGYLLASLIKGRQATSLSTELNFLQKEHENTQNQSVKLQEQIKQQEQQLHEQKLKETTLSLELNNARKNSDSTEQRLQADLAQAKREISQHQTSLNTLNLERNALNAQAQSSHTQVQALQKQLEERDQRLDRAQKDLIAERNQVSNLKDGLAQEGKNSEGLSQRLDEMRVYFQAQQENLKQQEAQLNNLQKDYRALSGEHTELKTTLEQKEQHFKEQYAQLNDAKLALGKEFENLANKIFEEKGKAFSHSNQASLDAMLKPFREQIAGFQQRINDVHDASLKGNTLLNAEIKKVLDIGLKMSQEATDLTNALKGDSQQRGAWGEAQLERTLEISGLIKDVHYGAQSSFLDEHGKRKQTDYLIKLPDNKNIIIDSKVSLIAYDRAVNAQNTDDYQQALSEHSKAVRRHIDELASKDYTNLVGMHSPSFVLMFMPIEPAYIEVLKYEKDLFEYGYKRGIVLVSHTTLIPILRTISNLWMIERSNSEARELSERAGEIYNNVSLLAERLEKLGGTLNTASNHYNSTVTALVGKQGLYGKVERFNQISAKANKELPALTPSQIEFQTAGLGLLVEPIAEPPTKD